MEDLYDAPTHAPVVDIQGLTKHFASPSGSVTAVNGLTFSVRAGEIIAFLGPNGAGKTTTIDMMLGLTKPDAGSVKLFGVDARQAVNEGHVSAVLQTGGLLADITVAETIGIIASLHKRRERIPEVMKRARLEGIAKRKVGKCSGGEQQRVKFALALVPDPELLILDEPTAGMDVHARKAFWQEMRVDAARGRTIIFATHYLEEAEHFAERTVVVHRGTVVADANTSELRNTLGTRTLKARVPMAREAEFTRLAREICHDPRSQVRVQGGEFWARTVRADQLAAAVLERGATDLEIAAPTLESAFTTLTEEA
ncbi:ABC transporter ATP-binding protein [Leucobacter sp. UCMA 4100]|uniref:ABC transporter ATP-binding protein n=1 Tax=Leucobacter sp. UCMA 4100 TaxID=2810534 RepID=UPI0022EAB57A|nr:ABC transporter ATP-binding protein [Leucobacter sp. UCMA 4100]MDA3146255.1 ABC transporter ATP-binding protein [Leucobacter sp. UCMA 4100]